MTVSRAVVELQRQLSRVATEKATVEQQRRAAMDTQRLEAAQARARTHALAQPYFAPSAEPTLLYRSQPYFD